MFGVIADLNSSRLVACLVSLSKLFHDHIVAGRNDWKCWFDRVFIDVSLEVSLYVKILKKFV